MIAGSLSHDFSKPNRGAVLSSMSHVFVMLGTVCHYFAVLWHAP
jgi:predicted membrane channel-forming protein YqfA (hemolysin III family)